jgi:histone-arginine methyltransferase CARM1
VKQRQRVIGKVILKSNKRQSYDVEISLGIPGTTIKSSNILDLKNPFFRYSGQQPQPPPGTNTASPSENYWNQQDLTGQAAVAAGVQPNAFNVALLNGAMGDGSQLLQVGQTGVVYNNLVPLGNIAQIHPGSIPSPGVAAISVSQQALQTRTSVGGGISPILMAAQGLTTASHSQQQQQLIGNQYMIGDYLMSSNNVLSAQGLGLMN